MKKLILLFVFTGTFNGLFPLAQTTFLCPESIISQPHAEWWPIPGFIPADGGWVFTEWDLRTDFSIPDSLVPHMQRLVEALKTRDITLVGIPIPPRGMLHAAHLDKSNPLAAAYLPETATQNYLGAITQYEALGIVMVNPLPYLTGDIDSYSFKNDIHWRPEGAQQVAQAVAATLAKLPEISALPRNNYTLHKGIVDEYDGMYTKEVMKRCNTQLPKEHVQRFYLSGGSEVGLLDETVPTLMLLGSSFSSETFAFDTFLKAATGWDIVTLFTDGGTKWYSLERLFVNDGTPLPKVILWEFPAIAIPDWDVRDLRRIIPMIYGPCTDERTLRTEERTLSTTEKTLIENPDALPITGSKYFVQLDFPDVTVRNFLLNFVYKDGSSETLRVQRNDRVENEGRYQIELSDSLTGNLDKIEFQEGEYQGLVTTKLCTIN